MLKKLENVASSVEEEKQKSNEENLRLQAKVESLVSQNKELESSLKDLQGLRQTVLDMEEKLKDLQTKLQGEANEKRVLETKYDEVSSEVQ